MGRLVSNTDNLNNFFFIFHRAVMFPSIFNIIILHQIFLRKNKIISEALEEIEKKVVYCVLFRR
jgi:hypothetical protein